jgi:hypothetical protein
MIVWDMKSRKPKMNRTIIATQILIQWNDSPKMEILFNDMPDGLRQDFDEWLSDIEAEENER